MKVGIITVSDSGARGERRDESGPEIRRIMEGRGAEVVRQEVIPDDEDAIFRLLCEMADSDALDLVLTTGGTGLSPRDFTPEATKRAVDKEVPGIAEKMRFTSWQKTPHGMLSRGVAGSRKKTLIVNLPGSPRAVRECLEAVADCFPHAIEVLRGEAKECASKSAKSALESLPQPSRDG